MYKHIEERNKYVRTHSHLLHSLQFKILQHFAPKNDIRVYTARFYLWVRTAPQTTHIHGVHCMPVANYLVTGLPHAIPWPLSGLALLYGDGGYGGVSNALILPAETCFWGHGHVGYMGVGGQIHFAIQNE